MKTMDIIKKSKNLIEIFHKRKNPIDRISSKHLEIWLNRAKRHIILCNKVTHKGNLHPGTIRRLQAILGHFKTIKKSIEHKHIGLGFWENISKRVMWENVISSFGGRIRTGVIINLAHKNINQFLKDCFTTSKNKIKVSLKKFLMLKVDTNFCGEFIKKCGGKDIKEFKYFNTKNVVIDVGVDLE